MKRLLLVAGIAVTLVIAFAADTSRAQGVGGGVSISAFACGMYDGDGNIATVSGDVGQWKNNHNFLFCSGTGLANHTGHRVHYDSSSNPGGPGAGCSAPGLGTTTNWDSFVTASGRGFLLCRF